MSDRLDDYDYSLPEELIAQKPAFPRESSRLLVLHRKEGRWEHRRFTDLPEYLGKQDVLVANNTQVMRARLLGRRVYTERGEEKVGGKTEFVLLEKLGDRLWEGLFKASTAYVPGVRFRVEGTGGVCVTGELVRGSADSPFGTVVARFDEDPTQAGVGELPLPPYIEAQDPEAQKNYQTVYARELGSAAAPTAGLHFSESVLSTLKDKGVGWEELTLHVGLGTFRPIKEEDVSKHRMHEERYFIPKEVAERLTLARNSKKRLVAVGTTSARTLESAWDRQAHVFHDGDGRTDLYVRPGAYEFGAVGALITNFHLPRSTLLLLVSALAGRELILSAYEDAVRERYRFFSYGDAMLIL